MEINLNLRQLALGAAAIGLIVLLAVVGHAVTPVAEGSPLVLTPERWEAAALARRAGAEIVRLEADGRAPGYPGGRGAARCRAGHAAGAADLRRPAERHGRHGHRTRAGGCGRSRSPRTPAAG